MDILDHVEKGHEDIARTFYWRAKRGDRTWRAIRDGQMKYVYKIEGGEVEEGMYDLSKDRAESNDLLKKRPKVARQLKSKLVAWEKAVHPLR